MLVHLKRRVGVLSAVAVMAALLPVLTASVATAIPATALAPMAAGDGATYSACPAGSAAAAGFTDTTSTDVDCIAMHGITTGVTATTYEPTANVPRWQMALYLTRMATSAGVTLGSGADQGFTDISGYSAAIQTAINQIKQLGVTVGKTATTYAPDDNVTREEMALFLDRTLAATPVGPGGNSVAGGNCLATCLNVNSTSTGTGEYNYDDIDGGSVTFEGHNSIVEIYQLGITGDLTTVRAFNPSTAITRATMATWVTNALAHTNARPAGLWLQSDEYAGFTTDTTAMTVSYRDSSRVPVSGKVIDLFEWQNAATTADNAAITAAGACATNVAITSTSLTKCKVEVGDPTTNTSGNFDFAEAVAADKTNSYFAWTAATGTTFANATHGSGTDYHTVNVARTGAATIALISANLNAAAVVDTSTYPDMVTVKYGDTVTITTQMAGTKVGAAWPSVAMPLQTVTYTHTIYAVGAPTTVESVTTTITKTDASGTSTYAVTDADPATTLASTRHSIKIVSGTGTETSAAADNTPGSIVSSGGVETLDLSFDDAVSAYNTTSLATNLVSYKAGTALAPVARTVTSSNTDQYGNAHVASAGDTVKFQGAAISGTGLVVCKDSSDLCYIQGRQITIYAPGVVVPGILQQLLT